MKKIQKHQLRFTWGLLKKRPFSVLIQVTNRCNMKCSFCDFWPNGAPPRQELTLDEYQRLANDLAQLGCFLISIEGGEPFLRPDLIDIIRIFSQQHLTVLYTNGWYVTPEKAQQLFEVGLHQVGISIDYATAEKHDQKRVLKGAFQQAWKAVQFFREASPSSAIHNKQVHVMTVLMQDNYEELEALLQQSESANVAHCLTLLSTEGFRRGQHQDQWPSAPISEHLLTLWKKYPHLMVFQEYLAQMDDFLNQKPFPTCRAGKQGFNIDHLGNVSPCIEKIQWIAGNVREHPLSEIYKKLQNWDGIQDCQDCWTLCRGFNQILGNGGSWKGWRDLSTRMKGN